MRRRIEKGTEMSETNNSSVLSEYDFIVVIDTSGSMGDPVKAGSPTTRWEAVQESAITLIRDVEKLDTDGLGLVLFGATVESFDQVGVAKARDVFATTSPRGGTPLAEALTAALALAGKSAKKDFIVVFTDGVPNDQAAAAAVIKNAANGQETDDALTKATSEDTAGLVLDEARGVLDETQLSELAAVYHRRWPPA